MLTYKIVFFSNTAVADVLFRYIVPKIFTVLTGRKTPPAINLPTMSAGPYLETPRPINFWGLRMVV